MVLRSCLEASISGTPRFREFVIKFQKPIAPFERNRTSFANGRNRFLKLSVGLELRPLQGVTWIEGKIIYW